MTDLSNIRSYVASCFVTVAVQNGSLERSRIATIILDAVDLRLGEVEMGESEIHQGVRTKAVSKMHKVCVGQMSLEQNNVSE